MDSARFDALTRCVPATGSRRRAFMATLGGSLAALALRDTVAKKKKKKKACPTCDTSDTCPTCPPRDTCPTRSCCVCKAGSATPGCQFGPTALTLSEAIAACEQVCGGADKWFSAANSLAGQSQVCNTIGSECVTAGCPL